MPLPALATVGRVTDVQPLRTLWIELAGADNVRDVGGLPTLDGGRTRPGRLIRSDNLQLLTESDVRQLVDVIGVRKVADLRSEVEVEGEGPGPMTREPAVQVVNMSLLPEVGRHTDAAATAPDAPVILPWQTRNAELTDEERRQGASATYLRYLTDRADSIVAALRLIAHGDGATIVHCAAGKDRTGTVIALALDHVGVDRGLIAADYALSAERVPRVFARLAQRRTYASDISGRLDDIDRHKPKAPTILALFEGVERTYGGTEAWLRSQGWTDTDAAALRSSLLG